jgi:chromosome partitioning protein
MPVITIASTKGGVGKSTVAVNLAACFVRKNLPVALLDSDPQGSVGKWNKVREMIIATGEKLPSIFVASAQGESLALIASERSNSGSLVLIDSAGVDDRTTRTALVRSDAILTLAAPTPIDLWEIDPLLKLVQNMERVQGRRVPVYLLFNKVPTHVQSRSIEMAINFLNENMIFPTAILSASLKDRMIFKNTIGEGKSVSEYVPSDRNALNEVEAVADELLITFQSLQAFHVLLA